MSEQLALLARTFLIGIAVAAPVGAMGVLCIQRTLARGWRAGAVTGLGIASADALYAGLAAFGVSAVSSAMVAWQTPLKLVGGAVLVYLGLSALRSKPAETPAADAVDVAEPGHGSLYLSSVALTLTNPMTIMAFAAVFASAGLVTAPSAAAALTATAGVAAGSLSWWIMLTSVVSAVRHGLSPTAVHWVARLSGVLVAGFGVVAIVSALAER